MPTSFIISFSCGFLSGVSLSFKCWRYLLYKCKKLRESKNNEEIYTTFLRDNREIFYEPNVVGAVKCEQWVKCSHVNISKSNNKTFIISLEFYYVNKYLYFLASTAATIKRQQLSITNWTSAKLSALNFKVAFESRGASPFSPFFLRSLAFLKTTDILNSFSIGTHFNGLLMFYGLSYDTRIKRTTTHKKTLENNT